MSKYPTNTAQTVAKDRAAEFEALKAKNERFVRNAAMRLTNNHQQDAEDLAQETWVAAFSNFDTFRGDGDFKSWLRRIEVNIWLMILRAKKRRPPCLSLDEMKAYEDGESRGYKHGGRLFFALGPSQKLEKEIRDRNIRLAVDRIPPDYKRALLLADVEGLHQGHVATLCGVTYSAGRTRVRRAREKVREKLGSEEDIYALYPLKLQQVAPAAENGPVKKRARIALEP